MVPMNLPQYGSGNTAYPQAELPKAGKCYAARCACARSVQSKTFVDGQSISKLMLPSAPIYPLLVVNK